MPARTDLVPVVIDLKGGTARPKDRLSGRVDLTFTTTPMLGCIVGRPAGDEAPTSGPAARGWREPRTIKRFVRAPLSFCRSTLPGLIYSWETAMRYRVTGERWAPGLRRLSTCNSQWSSKKGWSPRAASREYGVPDQHRRRTATIDSLNDALTIANSNMMRWFVDEYRIEPIAAHLLIGHQAKYDVVALSGVMAVKIPNAYCRRGAEISSTCFVFLSCNANARRSNLPRWQCIVSLSRYRPSGDALIGWPVLKCHSGLPGLGVQRGKHALIVTGEDQPPAVESNPAP